MQCRSKLAGTNIFLNNDLTKLQMNEEMFEQTFEQMVKEKKDKKSL